ISPSWLGAYCRRSAVTTTFLTSALVHQIGRESPGALAGLHTLVVGGDAVEPRWVAAITAAGGPAHIRNGYGPTETTTFAAWHELTDIAADAATSPIGGPIAQTTCDVLAPDGAVLP